MTAATDRMRALAEETAAIHVDFLSPVVKMAFEEHADFDWAKVPASQFKRAVLRAASGPASFEYVTVSENRVGLAGSFNPNAGDEFKPFSATLFAAVEHAAKGTTVEHACPQDSQDPTVAVMDAKYDFECLAIIGARRPVGYVTAVLVYKRADS